MKILIAIAVVTVLIALYVTTVRPRLRQSTRPSIVRFFEVIEPVEIALWRKSETLLKARAKMVLGVVLTALTQIGALDLTPLMPLVPDQYEPMLKFVFNLMPMVLTVGGWVDEQLRKDTTKPLEIVEQSTAVVANDPAVAEVVAQVENANAIAVETIKAKEAA